MDRSNLPPSPINDLAAGGLRGDECEAWKLFVAAWPRLERFVRVRLIMRRLPAELLEDCGQEIFTRVWRFRTSYRGAAEAEFWGWLRRICDNERRRILSRNALRRTGSLDVDQDVMASAALPTSPDNAADKSTLNEELNGLRDCLRNLSDSQRRVIELLYFEPVLSQRSAAALMGCSPSNVHRLKLEALRALKACLARKGIR